ncbi:MAG: DUF805 domain-containing protein [Minwuia sp.]|uniref:DUF805 domain-containing protein n=1 Tax=Minwuia sp. TaxID=2493630 RepID=UPI003A86F386
MNWYIAVLKNYAVFQGRARRAEFWWFFLINLIISLILGTIDGALGFSTGPAGEDPQPGLLSSIYSLAVLIPGLAVGVRRLHDTGRSGWWLLLYLVPILGWIALVVMWVLNSDEGDNRFGPNPKTGGPQPGGGDDNILPV